MALVGLIVLHSISLLLNNMMLETPDWTETDSTLLGSYFFLLYVIGSTALLNYYPYHICQLPGANKIIHQISIFAVAPSATAYGITTLALYRTQSTLNFIQTIIPHHSTYSSTQTSPGPFPTDHQWTLQIRKKCTNWVCHNIFSSSTVAQKRDRLLGLIILHILLWNPQLTLILLTSSSLLVGINSVTSKTTRKTLFLMILLLSNRTTLAEEPPNAFIPKYDHLDRAFRKKMTTVARLSMLIHILYPFLIHVSNYRHRYQTALTTAAQIVLYKITTTATNIVNISTTWTDQETTMFLWGLFSVYALGSLTLLQFVSYPTQSPSWQRMTHFLLLYTTAPSVISCCTAVLLLHNTQSAFNTVYGLIMTQSAQNQPSSDTTNMKWTQYIQQRCTEWAYYHIFCTAVQKAKRLLKLILAIIVLQLGNTIHTLLILGLIQGPTTLLKHKNITILIIFMGLLASAQAMQTDVATDDFLQCANTLLAASAAGSTANAHPTNISHHAHQGSTHTQHETGLRGDQQYPLPDHTTFLTINSRGKITHNKWSQILTLASNHDFVSISETGPDNAATRLRFMARSVEDKAEETDERTDKEADKLVKDHHIRLQHMIYSSNGTLEKDGTGGVLLLVHERWRHRIVGAPIVSHCKRWISLLVHTPTGPLRITTAYMPPSPQTSPQRPNPKLKMWDDFIEFTAKYSAGNISQIVFGDLNVSTNIATHRHHPGHQHNVQNELLRRLLHRSNLVDSFTYRHTSNTHYKTWRNTDTWSSPDHILVSTNKQEFITHASVSDIPVVDYGLDHSTVLTALDLGRIHTAARTTRPEIGRVTSKTQEKYVEAVQEATELSLPHYTRTNFHTFLQQLPSLSTKVTPHKTANVSPKTFRVSNLQNNIRTLNKVKYYLTTERPLPTYLKNRRIVQTLPDITLHDVNESIKLQKQQYNSKARKKQRVLSSIYTRKRSQHFQKSRLGKFLNLAYNKFSHYRGVIGLHNEDNTAINTDPQATRTLASKLIFDTYFTLTKTIPDFFTPLGKTEDTWGLLPPWFREVFSNIQTAIVDPIYTNIMDSIEIKELNKVLSKMGRNKTPGESHVTVEHLLYLSDEQKHKWLIPYINDCLVTGDIPDYTKPFNVWCTEKAPNTGSIMHPTNKLNVRPISLLEVSAKLVEAVVNSRLQSVMLRHNKLSPIQYGFTPGRKVTDALLIYSFLFEDAKDTGNDLFISNNDCTRAYDSIAPWVMEATYAYHRFPPELSTLLLNMDSGRWGKVITAHGAGDPHEKTCGLGQGSIIAPLKWNLLLQPLLARLTDTADPYTIGTGAEVENLWALAFADDISIIASTEKG